SAWDATASSEPASTSSATVTWNSGRRSSLRRPSDPHGPRSVRGSDLVRLLGVDREDGVGGSEAGDGHPVGGAGHVVDADPGEERDRLGSGAVLPAATQFGVGADLTGSLGARLDDLADAAMVDGLERVPGQQPLFEV